MSMKKRILALLLAAVMTLSLLPGAAFAVDETAVYGTSAETAVETSVETVPAEVAEPAAGEPAAGEPADDDTSILSLLPLEEVALTAHIVVTDEAQKSVIRVRDFMDSITFDAVEGEDGEPGTPGGRFDARQLNVILWNDGTMEDPAFRQVDRSEGTVDLSALPNGGKLQFIGGNSTSQFDASNKRYIVTVNFGSLPQFATPVIYPDAEMDDSTVGTRTYFGGETATFWLPPNSDLSADYYLRLYDMPTDTAYYTTKVYKGIYSKDDALPTEPDADVTDALFRDGLKTNFAGGTQNEYTVVFRDMQGAILECKSFVLTASVMDINYPREVRMDLYEEAEDGLIDEGKYIDNQWFSTDGEPQTRVYTLPLESTLEDSYFLRLSGGIRTDDEYYAARILKGAYTEVAIGAAPAESDITADILSRAGYKMTFAPEQGPQVYTVVITNKADNTILALSSVTLTARLSVPSPSSSAEYTIDADAGRNSETSYIGFNSGVTTRFFDAVKPLTEPYFLYFDPTRINSPHYTARIYDGVFSGATAEEAAAAAAASDKDITDRVTVRDAYSTVFGVEQDRTFTFVFSRADEFIDVKYVTFNLSYNAVTLPSYAYFDLYQDGLREASGSFYLSPSSSTSSATFSVPQRHELSETFKLMAGASPTGTSNLYNVAVYKGNFTTPEEIAALPAEDNITEALFGDGIDISFTETTPTHGFTVVFTRKMDGISLGLWSLTARASLSDVSTPTSAVSELTVTAGEEVVSTYKRTLSFSSTPNTFGVSQKYPFDTTTFNLRLPELKEEFDRSNDYTARIITGKYATEEELTAAEAAEGDAKPADVTEALLGGGYALSFAGEATEDGEVTQAAHDFTFVFERKRDGLFLAAKTMTVTAEHAPVAFPNTATFALLGPTKDKTGANKGTYEQIGNKMDGGLREDSAPTVFFAVQPKVYSLVNDKFRLTAEPFNPDDLITAVYKGTFADLESLPAADSEAVITEAIFSEEGYETDFNNELGEQEFTFVYTNRYNTQEYKIFPVIVSAVYYTENLSDYKRVVFTGAKLAGAGGEDSEADVDVYKIRDEDDSYAQFGYQTFFVDPGAGVNVANLVPTFTTEDTVGVYAQGRKQASGVNAQNFMPGAVLYTAVAQDTRTAANYQVNFIDRTADYREQLYVSGPSTREVYFNELYGDKHDILIANIGSHEMRNIRVTLEDAVNVKLDNYWTAPMNVLGNNLAAFESVDSAAADYGELSNLAKIRLLRDETGDGGDIGGRLVITAETTNDGVSYSTQTREITLAGSAGRPDLMSGGLDEAVKYVPYSFVLQTNNIHNDETKPMYNQVTFEAVGDLPPGLELFPNGELYGVPTQEGDFKVKIKVTYSLEEFEDEEVEFDLKINPNTDEFVNAQVDVGYEIREGSRIQNMTTATYRDQEWILEGEFDFFTALWLDGKLLKEDIGDGTGGDYKKRSGSVVITNGRQTFATAGVGTHTIAAEFRVGGDKDNELKKAAQNYTVTDVQTNNPGTTNPGTSNPGSSNNGSVPLPAATPTPAATPSTAATPAASASPVRTAAPQPVIDAPTTITSTVDISAVTEDGAASAAITAEALADALSQALIDAESAAANSPIVIDLNVTGLTEGVNALGVAIPMESVLAVADTGNAAIKLSAGDLGTITVPSASLKDIALLDGEVLQLNITRTEGEVKIELHVGETLIEDLEDGLRVELPGLASREVPVLLRTDGGEELVKKSTVTDGNVVAIISGSGTVSVVDNSKTFGDVSETDWFFGAMSFVNSRALFNGVSESEMAPNALMTRAMFATVLNNLEDNEDLGEGTEFADVPADAWFAQPVAWASNAGIITGYGDGMFGAGDNITREQLAVMAMKYAQYIGMDTSERGDVSAFNDGGMTSDWANDAVRWAVSVGLMQGDDNSNLNPGSPATRAEAAIITMNLIKHIVT